MIDLPDLLKLISAAWPARWTQGRIVHIHQNDTTLPDGSKAHIRVLIQTVSEPPQAEKGTR